MKVFLARQNSVQSSPNKLCKTRKLVEKIYMTQENSKHQEPAFGFWVPVTDRPSAEYAAKMSGFPVFLVGIIFFIMAVIQFMFLVGAETIDIVINIVVLSLTLLFAIYLIVSGLLIRSLKFQTLPISIAIWLMLQIWGVFSLGIGVSTIFTVLLGLMAISGLRGWLWLRKNPFSSEEFS